MINFANSYKKYVSHLEHINEAAREEPARLILETEEAYRKNLSEVADAIERSGDCRIVLLSGPSSSGKTTTAHRLMEELEARGIHSVSVSLDDFYRGEYQAPILPDGSHDYEAVEALDVDAVKRSLSGLVRGEVCELPVFDFIKKRPAPEKRTVQLQKDSVAVIEGIHALNPIFAECVPHCCTMKLYVSVKQGIKDETGVVLSNLELRLLRRVVRDYHFRGTGAETTFEKWKNVIDGENKYIRPFRFGSDFTINSIHIYEPCVIREHAIPILSQIEEDSLWKERANELTEKLSRFAAVPSELVPQDSMLREFIGKT